MKLISKAMITVLIVLVISFGITSKAAGDVNPDPYQRIVITMLYPNIDKAINAYYGETIRGYDLYNSKISNLESLYGWSNFNVTVNVETFYGAHNPPRALEIMTFHVTLGKEPTLIKYEHKDIST